MSISGRLSVNVLRFCHHLTVLRKYHPTMKEMVTLNKKEQKRLIVLNQVGSGKLTARLAIALV